jgi:large repetitive protein
MAVSFTQSVLAGDTGLIGPPSALQWGPDGKLYVASRFGDIAVLEVAKTGPGAYV